VTFTRTIYDCSVRREGNEAVISVTGSGFLYNMVRIIAGTLMDVGLGRKEADRIPAIIDSLDRRQAGPTLPACGLMLVGYEYNE
jgi:tRNA pseudouridine38-40 synthase